MESKTSKSPESVIREIKRKTRRNTVTAAVRRCLYQRKRDRVSAFRVAGSVKQKGRFDPNAEIDTRRPTTFARSEAESR